MEQPEQPKRKRGRPRKTDLQRLRESLPGQPKRPLGRPRKDIENNPPGTIDPEIEQTLSAAKRRMRMVRQKLDEIDKDTKELRQKREDVIKEQERYERDYRSGIVELRKRFSDVPFTPTAEQLKVVVLAWELIREGYFPDIKMLAAYSDKKRDELREKRLSKYKPGTPEYKKEESKKPKTFPAEKTIREWFKYDKEFKKWFVGETLKLSSIPEELDKAAYAAILRKHAQKGSVQHLRLFMEFMGWEKPREQKIQLETKQKTINYNELTPEEKEAIEKKRALEAWKNKDLRMEDEESLKQAVEEGRIQLDDAEPEDDYSDEYDDE